jgi:hypothetical protein
MQSIVDGQSNTRKFPLFQVSKLLALQPVLRLYDGISRFLVTRKVTDNFLS